MSYLVFHQHEVLKNQVLKLNKKAKDLRDSMPAVEFQAVESFCAQERPLTKISDAYMTGFFKCQELTLQQPDNIEGIEIPINKGVTPEIETKILEKKEDVLAILQLIREKEPDILEKLWLAVLILSSEVLHGEGRKLGIGKTLKCVKCLNVAVKISESIVVQKNNVASPNQMQNKPTAEGVKTMEDGFVDAFRPTTPGHSPGVGHSKHD
ncbi:hypothetical protein LguiA_006142 [Lonicera macranthoides]